MLIGALHSLIVKLDLSYEKRQLHPKWSQFLLPVPCRNPSTEQHEEDHIEISES